MQPFEVELPNGSDGDALVHVRLPLTGESALFDAGDVSRLAQRDVLRLSHLLVSHCHVDHFVGFDALVRPRVCRDDTLVVHGPPGFLHAVTCRLDGYTWNLIEGNHFVVEAREVSQDSVRRARFDSNRSFRREDLPGEPRDGSLAHVGPSFSTHAAILDHHVVSMGWALQAPARHQVRMEAVTAAGLLPGPWLAELKRLAESSGDGSQAFAPPGRDAAPLRSAVDDFLVVRPGWRVAYVTDTICAPHTRPRIVELIAGADVFACGAPFLDAEAERAAATRHLTARQAGEMAAEAGARRLLLFHVSDRYGGDFRRHVEQASEGARGAVEVEVRPPLGPAPTEGAQVMR